MRHARVLLPGLILMVNAVGCTMVGPRYPAHVSNTLALREAGLAKVQVGEFRRDPRARRNVDRLTARAMKITSAYGTYTAYLREAFSSEFDHADLLDPGSGVRIDGTLLRNELAAGPDGDYALIEADVTVTRDGAIAYRGEKTARFEWKSAFPAEVAVPRAIANYQVGVQRLIAAYIADPEFVTALKKR
jgi:hypothetical protein